MDSLKDSSTWTFKEHAQVVRLAELNDTLLDFLQEAYDDPTAYKLDQSALAKWYIKMKEEN
ncbi:hypothetical protein [Weissella confusa]|uniref:hypothetical protein n=1 Tax=Weissella confusa TaxID=1583 RepID=UPI00223B1D57|nr:hypothetical protein [Weissella confusa]MCS9991222.1 hypothetical protein [Weissella confusa]